MIILVKLAQITLNKDIAAFKYVPDFPAVAASSAGPGWVWGRSFSNNSLKRENATSFTYSVDVGGVSLKMM